MGALLTIIKKIWPLLLIVGCVCWAFGVAYTGLTIIQQKTITYGSYTWTYWEFDVRTYVKALEYSLTDSNVFNVIPTQPKLTQSPDWTDILQVLKWAFNTFFIYVFNWIIYAINAVVLAPIKLILYPENILYALFGLNTTNADFVTATKWIYSAQIPLIPSI